MVFLKEIFEKVYFEKKSADNKKKHAKLPSRQRVKNIVVFRFFPGYNLVNYNKTKSLKYEKARITV